jgi:DNA repair exonuclease SbcCD ATPase subunit
MSSMNAPAMTARKRRAVEIAEREAELVRQRSEFDRRRTAAFQETGRKVPATDAERQVRAELRALADERKALLDQIGQLQAALRLRQGELARARATAVARRGKKALPPVTKAEKKLRSEMAALDSERAWLDGTVQGDRDMAATLDAIYESSHDPLTYGKGDW